MRRQLYQNIGDELNEIFQVELLIAPFLIITLALAIGIFLNVIIGKVQAIFNFVGLDFNDSDPELFVLFFLSLSSSIHPYVSLSAFFQLPVSHCLISSQSSFFLTMNIFLISSLTSSIPDANDWNFERKIQLCTRDADRRDAGRDVSSLQLFAWQVFTICSSWRSTSSWSCTSLPS